MVYKRPPAIIAPLATMCTDQVASDFPGPFARFLLCNSSLRYIRFVVIHEHYSIGDVFNFDRVTMIFMPVPHLPVNYQLFTTDGK